MTYNQINEKGDFIESGCLFDVGGDLYTYSGVIHDDQLVFGIKICSMDSREHKFKFDEITVIYKPHII